MKLLLFTVLLWFNGFSAIGTDQLYSDTEQVIMDKALESVYARYDANQYRFVLSKQWIPGGLLSIKPDHIRSVELEGTLRQYATFQVRYLEAGKASTAEIQLKVEAEQILPVLKARKSQGEVLSEEDFHNQWVQINPERDQPITSSKRLSGKTLLRTLNAGQPVMAGEISSPFIVEAGEPVDLIFYHQSIRVLLKCDARQNGTEGEEIQIYCKETRKKYAGEVKSPGVVQWKKTL